ncbi:hypothetical protein ACIPW4_15215 [Pseudomonas sp. NPDC089996]|uniref:hypothetical protein n=1 Tax=Pseudomonas sp. NPDC089996 TaxID=3364474 RepID=UPI003801CADF
MKKSKLIIDTNLLLLLIVGSIENGRHIKSSNRLKAFKESDYQNVLNVMQQYRAVYITPYIATEISNLIDLTGYVYERALEVARAFFRIFEKINSDIEEDSAPALFLRYGITDTSLVKLAGEYTILTNDARLLPPLYEACPENVLPYELVKAARAL